MRTTRQIRQDVDDDLKRTQHKHMLEQLPGLTEGQARTLAAHPEICDKLRQVFGDAELFHAWLKKRGEDG